MKCSEILNKIQNLKLIFLFEVLVARLEAGLQLG